MIHGKNNLQIPRDKWELAASGPIGEKHRAVLPVRHLGAGSLSTVNTGLLYLSVISLHLNMVIK